MKIAICLPSWPAGFLPNGIVTYGSYMVPALRRLGHEVFVLSEQEPGNAESHTVYLSSFGRTNTIIDKVLFRLNPELAGRAYARARMVPAIRKLVAAHQVDIFEREESFGHTAAISGLNLLPVVVRLHGPRFLTGRFGSDDYAGDLRRERMEGNAIRQADFVSSPSAATLDAVSSHYGLHLEASRVIPNPIQSAASTETWAINSCLPESFLFVGRVDKLKGADVALQAFAEIASHYPKAKLTLIGPDRGIRGQGGKISFFDDFVGANIPEQHIARIKFCGPVNRSDVLPHRRKHFATIICSSYETSPYAVLEAMACGSPIIATAVGGIPELITHNRNGLLVPPRDVDALANACRTLLEDKALASRLGKQAWLDCREFYDPDAIARQTVAVYQEAVDVFKSRAT